MTQCNESDPDALELRVRDVLDRRGVTFNSRLPINRRQIDNFRMLLVEEIVRVIQETTALPGEQQ